MDLDAIYLTKCVLLLAYVFGWISVWITLHDQHRSGLETSFSSGIVTVYSHHTPEDSYWWVLLHDISSTTGTYIVEFINTQHLKILSLENVSPYFSLLVAYYSLSYTKREISMRSIKWNISHHWHMPSYE